MRRRPDRCGAGLHRFGPYWCGARLFCCGAGL